MTQQDIDLITLLNADGYFGLKVIPGRGICALFHFAYTVGLCVGLDATGYAGRYCYRGTATAKEALEAWDGAGDPDGGWIKYKGEGGERSNPNNSGKDEYNKEYNNTD